MGSRFPCFESEPNYLSRGSRASRRPSPKSLKPSTVTKMARPGNSDSQRLSWMKDTFAMPRVVVTMIGARQLGRTWRTRTRRSSRPTTVSPLAPNAADLLYKTFHLSTTRLSGGAGVTASRWRWSRRLLRSADARRQGVERQALDGGQGSRTWAYRLGSLSAPGRRKYAWPDRGMVSPSPADCAGGPQR